MSRRRGPVAPVRVGRRDPSLLVADPEKAAAEGSVYVVSRRPMRYRGYLCPVGTELPDAATWVRIEAWVNARLVRRTEPGEEYVPFDDFVASVTEGAKAAEAVEETPVAEEQSTTEE